MSAAKISLAKQSTSLEAVNTWLNLFFGFFFLPSKAALPKPWVKNQHLKINVGPSNRNQDFVFCPQVPPRHHLQVLRRQTPELRRGLRLLPEPQAGAGSAGEGGGAQHQDPGRAEGTARAFRLPARPLRRREEGLRLRKAGGGGRPSRFLEFSQRGAGGGSDF